MPTDHPQEHQLLEQMVGMGINIIHVRKPGYGRRKLSEYLKKLSPAVRRVTVIHQHHSLCLKFGIKGIHLTHELRKSFFFGILPAMWLKTIKPNLQVSTGFHNLFDLTHNHKSLFSYVFISPVFDSISKAGHKSNISLRRLQDTMDKTKYEVYALGGVDPSKVIPLKEANLHGCALMGAVWENQDPIAVVEEVLKKCRARVHSSL